VIPLRRRGRRRRWVFWSLVGLPVALFTFCVAIAPSHRPVSPGSPAALTGGASVDEKFRYLPDPEVYALDFDPRKVRFGLLEGWDREQEAYGDTSALAFVSGPMYERYTDAPGQEVTVPLGDIKLGDRVWRGRNRTASRQRAFIGITHGGRIDFGYGELTPEREGEYDTFIGGLHALYNDLQQPPGDYRGAYSVSMGQQIRYFLPRIRMVMGLRSDGRLEVFMSRDGLTLEQTEDMARRRGLVAAYMPDHASKSRFIIPGTKGFSEEDANWISGGATSFVHVPYMLRLEPRPFFLQGDLLANLTPLIRSSGCSNPVSCGVHLGGRVMDRALAGFNRLMERGVVPLARMVWRPSTGPSPTRSPAAAPLREPPITADPARALQTQPQPTSLPAERQPADRQPVAPAPLPPDLPAPEVVPDRSGRGSDAVYDPALPLEGGAAPAPESTPAPPPPPQLPPAAVAPPTAPPPVTAPPPAPGA
jgi:hypothetical protein